MQHDQHTAQNIVKRVSMVKKTSILKRVSTAFLLVGTLLISPIAQAHTIDNSSLTSNTMATHQKTYGLVFIVPHSTPDSPMAKLNALSQGVLNEKLTLYGIHDALSRQNIPHITVLHLHTSDTTIPEKMLKAMPKPPKPFTLTLTRFGVVKASKNAKMPWWFDINVQQDSSFESIMQYNFEATKALTPLRSSPLPRVSGAIYKDSSKEAQAQIRELGVSGLNRVIDGKEERMHRPHVTLSYSLQTLPKQLEKELELLANELNAALPSGIKTPITTISIVELGVTGNVMREIYRIDLESGRVTDVARSLQE